MSDPVLFGDPSLRATDREVASMTRSQREARLDSLLDESYAIFDRSIREHVLMDGRSVAAVGILFSGGNDSTVLAHLFRHHADFAGHANTGIGIEQTREFVRVTSSDWGLPLIERRAPNERDHYRHLVLTTERGSKGQAIGGFPGPAMHFKIQARLKERVLEQIQRELIANPYRERLVLLGGRRRSESTRRQSITEVDRRGSRVHISPLVNWTKPDMNTYRLRKGDVPVNQVADLVHMSGECLCGCMASPGEREEVSYWYPEPFEDIAEMEAELVGRDDIPEHRKTWGWGADPNKKAAETEYLKQFAVEEEDPETGLMCSSCDDRFQAAFDFGGAA